MSHWGSVIICWCSTPLPFVRGGVTAVPVSAWKTPPSAMAVVEVSSVQLCRFLCLSFICKALVATGMITEAIISVGHWAQGQTEKGGYSV